MRKFKNISNVSLLKDLKKVSVFLFIIYTIMYLIINTIFNKGIVGIFINFGLAMMIIILINMFLKKRLKYLDYIMNGISEIVDEDINNTLEIKGSNSFSSLAKNINQLSQLTAEILNDNVANNIRDTNVIEEISINYKAKQEDISKIFEVQKSNLKLNIEKININSIVEDMRRYYRMEFNEKKLQTKVTQNKYIYAVNGDRKLLTQVIRVIFINILKTSLETTRVYIDIYEDEEYICLDIKNVLKEDISEIEFRENKEFKISYVENALYIQNLKMYIEIESGLMKYKIRCIK